MLYTYTGRQLDAETGLYYYRARFYAAQLGRFVSRDPIGYRGTQWNVYEYAHSNPECNTDPQGLLADDAVLKDTEHCKVILFAGHIVPFPLPSFGRDTCLDLLRLYFADEYFWQFYQLHLQCPEGLPDCVAVGGAGCFAPELLYYLDLWFPGQHVQPGDPGFPSGRLTWEDAPRRLALLLGLVRKHAKDELCKAKCPHEKECEEVSIEVRCSPDMITAIETYGKGSPFTVFVGCSITSGVLL